MPAGEVFFSSDKGIAELTMDGMGGVCISLGLGEAGERNCWRV